jgi:hypothetical protein
MAASNNTDSDQAQARTLTLHGYGDKELFFALAQDSSWSLPMFVEWKHDKEHDRHYALVTPAVTLYVNQGLVMQALLQVHDVAGEKNRWIIPRNICEAVLHKAPGINPTYYYKWPDDTQPPLPSGWSESKGRGWKYPDLKDPDQVLNGQPFLKHVANKSGLPSSVVSIVFKAICQEAPAWMLENKQPLELGFCQLVALPFRVNWKEIVAFKCKSWKLRKLFSETRIDSELHAKLAELKMPSVMCSPQNIGLSRGKLEHTLEVIPTKKFQEAVDKSESQRMSCGWNAYVAHYEESVEKYYHLMVRALGYFIKKAAVPFARVHGSSVSGVVRFLPAGSSKQVLVHGVRVCEIPVHLISPDSNFSVMAESQTSDTRLVPRQAKEVLLLPDLPQASQDVRQRLIGPAVVEQGHPGTNGLPMLPPAPTEASG